MIRARVIARFPRLWVLWAASRPSQLALILLLYLLGIGLSTAGPPIIEGDPPATNLADFEHSSLFVPVIAGAIALLLTAVAIHYANEYADIDTDARTTRTPFSGGSGAMVETGLSPAFLFTAMIVMGIGALAVTGVLTVGRIFPIRASVLLLLGLVFGLAYSLPPIALVRQGIGEPVNMALGGLVLPIYGVAVVAVPTFYAALAVVPFTLVVGCNLLAVHWPDRVADEAVGKRTTAVRWSPARIRFAYATLAILAAVIVLLLWVVSIMPTIVALAHLPPVPFLLWGWTTLTRERSPLPAVTAMVVLAIALTIAWWWIGLG